MLVFCATAVTPARQLRTTRARIRLFIMASPFNKLDILHNENEAHMRSHCMAQRYYSDLMAVQGGSEKATTPGFRGTLLLQVRECRSVAICGLVFSVVWLVATISSPAGCRKRYHIAGSSPVPVIAVTAGLPRLG